MKPVRVMLVFVLSVNLTGSTVVNKCCPLGQCLEEETLNCIPSETEDEEDLIWFPHEALHNSETLDEMENDEKNLTIQWIRGSRLARFGVKPPCFSPHEYSSLNVSSFFITVNRDKGSRVFLYPSGPEEDQVPKVVVPVAGVCFDLVWDQPVVIYCPAESIPLPKCCFPLEIYNTSAGKCVSTVQLSHVDDWTPPLSDEIYFLRPGSFPNCTTVPVLARRFDKACRGFDSSATTRYYPNGSVQIKQRMHDVDQYCGERMWYEDEGGIIRENMVVCGIEQEDSPERIVYSIFFFIGCFCLMLTVIVSTILPEVRKKFHNKISMTHNATLMVAYFAWGTSMTLGAANDDRIIQCCFLSLLIQFTFLGSLFWLNAMCIDMTSKFRTIRAGHMRSTNCRYLIYGVYAWGLTAAISAFTMIMENVDEPLAGLPKPGLACHCGFGRQTASIFVYFYGPMALLLMFNLVLYIFTLYLIMARYRQTDILRRTGSSYASQSDMQKFVVYTKLFLLMGLTWVTEIIGWAMESGSDNFFWVMLDVINLLRAVFIFIIFTCNRKTFRQLERRFHLREKSWWPRDREENRSTISTIESDQGKRRWIRNIWCFNHGEELAEKRKSQWFTNKWWVSHPDNDRNTASTIVSDGGGSQTKTDWLEMKERRNETGHKDRGSVTNLESFA